MYMVKVGKQDTFEKYSHQNFSNASCLLTLTK